MRPSPGAPSQFGAAGAARTPTSRPAWACPGKRAPAAASHARGEGGRGGGAARTSARRQAAPSSRRRAREPPARCVEDLPGRGGAGRAGARAHAPWAAGAPLFLRPASTAARAPSAGCCVDCGVRPNPEAWLSLGRAVLALQAGHPPARNRPPQALEPHGAWTLCAGCSRQVAQKAATPVSESGMGVGAMRRLFPCHLFRWFPAFRVPFFSISNPLHEHQGSQPPVFSDLTPLVEGSPSGQITSPVQLPEELV